MTRSTMKHFWHFPIIFLLLCAGPVAEAFLPRRNRNRITLIHQSWNGKQVHTQKDSVVAKAASISDPGDSNRFSQNIVQALDLQPLMEAVSRHTGTRRARQALLSLVHAEYQEQKTMVFANSRSDGPSSSRARRAAGYARTVKPILRSETEITLTSIATTMQEAFQEYELVKEAVRVLEGGIMNVTFPPIYGPGSSPNDTETIAETDYDTWLRLPAEEWKLEHILQAEQVMGTIQKVKRWSEQEELVLVTPNLAQIGRQIPFDSEMASVLEIVTDAVKISRVRSITDPNGRQSFTFQLSADKYHVLRTMRDNLLEATERKISRNRNSPNTPPDKALVALQDNLEATEYEIQMSLVQSVKSVSSAIDTALNRMARLDILFSKASFGKLVGGMIPVVGSGGVIEVKKFVHPVLALASPRLGRQHDAVPVDLKLSTEDGYRALIISGPNGGGKTVAMKSFGMSAVLCKLGIPIPVAPSYGSVPSVRVDFFDNLHVSVGDRQSLTDGESTMMSRLNECSSILQRLGAPQPDEGNTISSLLLLDELGGGTDPTAGGAIAQAVLENMLEFENCRIVATTHVPRLKALSYRSIRFGCATVLLENRAVDDSSAYQLPAFELLYDSIGDSYALGAASRCSPPLPEGVISRAADLISSVSVSNDGTPTTSELSDDAAYRKALTESLERQAKRARQARITAEKNIEDSARCRRAMLSLASSYERHLSFMEDRLEQSFITLRNSDIDAFELIGDALSEVRLVKKRIKSQAETLKERGLKLLPESYVLSEGETVVVVSEGALAGITAKVLQNVSLKDRKLGPDDVVVLPSISPWDDPDGDFRSEPMADNDPLLEQPVILKRQQLAIWDFESVWDDVDSSNSKQYDLATTSVKESKRRLNSLLSDLGSAKQSKTAPAAAGESSFTSARERKAMKKKQDTKSKKTQRKRK